MFGGKAVLIKLGETLLAAVMFCGVMYFAFEAVIVFSTKDWSSLTTIYELITTVLALLLAFEVVRLIMVHSIIVVIELLLLVIARKMLYPDIHSAELIYYTIAFAIIIAVYYLYELKPLKSLEDLTK